MIFEQSWRWYGPHDPVTLADIKQAGAHGIVTALHHIPVGDLWTSSEIKERIHLIKESNDKIPFQLNWNVVESLPVHEHIKQGREDRDEYIATYCESLRNLAKNGIHTVCYNFMPVLDWLRTNVEYKLEDGSTALLHNVQEVAIFDLFILERENAASSYSKEILTTAKKQYQQMSAEAIEVLKSSILMALPGDKKGFTLEKLRKGLADYSDISADNLKENLVYFLNAVIPVATECGIKMAIHPDDPPWPVFGLPRVVSTAKDLDYIFEAVPDNANGLTFCSGSLGATAENSLPEIISKFYSRIHFIHLRSVARKKPFVFYEANHLEGNADMYKLIKTFFDHQQKNKRPPLPMRPDHGHKMLEDLKKNYYPGYSLIGRLRALAELRGLEHAILQNAKTIIK